MSERTSILTRLATLQVQIMTWLRGNPIGTDRFGNRYFEERRPRPGRRPRRWVLFNGEPEPTKVPPEWFGWLHHASDRPLPENSPFHKPWQKEHRPNLSGTLEAYRPPGHSLEQGRRPRATGDYEAWTPD